MNDLKVVTAESLSRAWSKYTSLFGEEPHGTEKQMAAMLEFVHEDAIAMPTETCRLVNNAYLPTNPNKLRTAHPDVKAAAVDFKERCRANIQTGVVH